MKFNTKQREALKNLNISIYTWDKNDYVEVNDLGSALGYSDCGTRLTRQLRASSNYAPYLFEWKKGEAVHHVRINGKLVSKDTTGPMTLLSVTGLNQFLSVTTERNVKLATRWNTAHLPTKTVKLGDTKVEEKVEAVSTQPDLSNASLVPLNSDASLEFLGAPNGFSKWPAQIQADFILALKKMEDERTEDVVKALDEFVGFVGKEFTQGELYGLMRVRTEIATGVNMRHLVPAHLIDTGWKTPTEIAKDLCEVHDIEVTKGNVHSVMHYLDFSKFKGTADSYRYITKAENVTSDIVLVQAYYYSPTVQNQIAKQFVEGGFVETVKSNAEKRKGKKATKQSAVVLKDSKVEQVSNGVPTQFFAQTTKTEPSSESGC